MPHFVNLRKKVKSIFRGNKARNADPLEISSAADTLPIQMLPAVKALTAAATSLAASAPIPTVKPPGTSEPPSSSIAETAFAEQESQQMALSEEVLSKIIQHMKTMMNAENTNCDQQNRWVQNSSLLPHRLINRQFCRVITEVVYMPEITLDSEDQVLQWVREVPTPFPFHIQCVRVPLIASTSELLLKLDVCTWLDMAVLVQHSRGHASSLWATPKKATELGVEQPLINNIFTPLMSVPSLQPFFNGLQRLDIYVTDVEHIVPCHRGNRAPLSANNCKRLCLPSLRYLSLYFGQRHHKRPSDFLDWDHLIHAKVLPSLKFLNFVTYGHLRTRDYHPQLFVALQSVGPQLELLVIDLGLSPFLLSAHYTPFCDFLSTLFEMELQLDLSLGEIWINDRAQEVIFLAEILDAFPEGSIQKLYFHLFGNPIWYLPLLCGALRTYESLANLNCLIIDSIVALATEVGTSIYFQELAAIGRERSITIQWRDPESLSYRILVEPAAGEAQNALE